MKEKNKETFQILSEILDIWLKTATSRIQGWQSKKEKNEAEQYLKEIQKNHGELEQYEFFEKDLGIFNSKIKYIFSIIQYIENNSRSLYGFE
ncbi:MAG: hypothetical protein LBU14_00765 [Candidatus Peribacteria bacterium]|nr:hypothetical protein [Candidatus Peribacteria bacterium]